MEKKPVAEYFKDHCEWFEDKAHQHWAFATKAEHKPKDWEMAQNVLDHTNTIEASWKCEIQLTSSPFEPAKSTEVFFILANATYKGIAHDYGAELRTIKSHAKPIYESVASLHKEGPGTKSLTPKRLIARSTSSIQLVKEQRLLSPALVSITRKGKRAATRSPTTSSSISRRDQPRKTSGRFPTSSLGRLGPGAP